MKTLTRNLPMRAVVGTLAVLALSSGGVSAARADAPEPADAEFASFISDLQVDRATRDALTERFEELGPAEQARFLEAAEEDPLSVIEFEDASEPTVSVQPTEGRIARAAASRYTATYPVSTSMFGITTGTFNLRYVFEATPSAVTRNLECTGWFTGTAGAWSVSTSSSQYTSGGSGTCSLTHRMSLFYKGSAWAANKHHQVTYRGTTLASAWLKNI